MRVFIMPLPHVLDFAFAPSNFSAIALVFSAMAFVSLIEIAIPLHRRSASNTTHLAPNLTLTLLYFAINLFFTAALVLTLMWLEKAGFGLFNSIEVDRWIELGLLIVVLDFQAYAAHVSMHEIPALWRFHRVHHADPAVDVTTALRQHPGESLIRFGFLSLFACAAGASPEAFALYRILSAIQALSEHANVQLPTTLDSALSIIVPSPNYHKVHHSRDSQQTNTNYSNIFSIWDRVFLTHTPATQGRDIEYGLDGYDGSAAQTTMGLLKLPFRNDTRAAISSLSQTELPLS